MAAVVRWSLRLFAFLAMLLFAALMVVFIIVTVDQFGEKQYVTDAVAGLPPVYVLTGLLVPFCAAFVAGFWLLFVDSFKRARGPDADLPVGLAQPEQPAGEPVGERLRQWGRDHRPHRPGWAHWPRRGTSGSPSS